jgi:transposase
MQITTIGFDLAKNVFQVHGIDVKEKVVARKQLRRGQVIAFFKALPPRSSIFGMALARRYASQIDVFALARNRSKFCCAGREA